MMLEHQNSSPQKPARVVIIGAGGFVGGAIAGELPASRFRCMASRGRTSISWLTGLGKDWPPRYAPTTPSCLFRRWPRRATRRR